MKLWAEMTDKQKKIAVLMAMPSDGEPTTAARLAVKLDEAAYRRHENTKGSDWEYQEFKNEIRLMLNMLRRENKVVRSEERAWYGNYYWTMAEQIREDFTNYRSVFEEWLIETSTL